MISKLRRIKSNSYYIRKTCLVKKQYSTSDEAAHTAGIESLKGKVHLKIYKCPYGDHWHLAKWRPK